MYNNFELTPKQMDSYDIAPLSEEFTRVTVTAEDGEYNALKDVGAFTYNGVNLPPLPEYDTEAYPYAIVYYAARNAGFSPYFAYSNMAFVVGESGVLTGASGAEVYIRLYDEGACEDAATFAWGAAVLSDGLSVDVDKLVWTNTTINDSAGAEVLHWSRAETATYKRYRYNGNLSPVLPEWDKEKYPYATIIADSNGTIFELDVTNVPGVIVLNDSGNIALKFSGTNILHSGWVTAPNQIAAAKWEDLSVDSLASSQKWTSYVEGQSRDDGWTIGNVIFWWSNYDLEAEDGTMVLEASDPVLEWLDLPYGRTLKVEIPWGTQRNADILLSTISDYRYQPFTASKVYLDPAAELGDGVTIGGTSAVLCSQEISLGSLTASTISAPEDEELDHEYTYKTKQERQAARTAAATKRAENVFSGTETAACLKASELYVGGQKFAPMTITYTDGSGNAVTATVLAAV